MKHQFKRVMAMLLVIAMVLSVMPSVFAANVEPFKDVQDNAWYAEYVKNVYEAGLMTGVKNDQFNPDGTSTRAQVVTVLYRVKGEPPVGGPATFTDLTADWYANPVAWAQKNNIVNGLTETKFGPNNNVTREQLVTMIWRYYGEPQGNGDLTAFSDHDKVSGYAKDAFAWAIGAGVINGSNGKLNPQGLATRAQFAKIIWVAKTYMDEQKPHEHVWGEGVVTKEATCKDAGVMTYTCECGETKTEEIPATNEHNYVNYICSVCGAEDPNKPDVPPVPPVPSEEYYLTAELKDGDSVIIYNAPNGKALTNVMSGFYVAGADLTAADGKISTSDASVIWTVKVNEDGSYTFVNGETELGADTSENNGKTYTNLYVEAGHKNKWALEVCSAENSSFFVTNTEIAAKYGKVYLEWYAGKTAFSAYDTSADRATEQDFGFQFYAKNPVGPCAHAWNEGEVTTAATCAEDGVMTYTCTLCGATKTEVIPATGAHNFVDGICSVCGEKEEVTTYALVSELKDGAKVIIYNAGNSKAVTNVMSGYYVAGADLTAAEGKITTNDASVVWTVKANADG
ncbi:MAG: S-layer homology domain-containing protein, partial [Oscillospiraceae bacterium]|nr:S-layer homology domain-containing protein [Oscillospiraceae bacterium]